jgi:hypothetical protein
MPHSWEVTKSTQGCATGRRKEKILQVRTGEARGQAGEY